MASGDDQAEGGHGDGAEAKQQDIWMNFLNEEDGVLSLKSWEDAINLGLNKKNGWCPLKEIIAQAWSESVFIFYFSTLSHFFIKNYLADLKRFPGRPSEEIKLPFSMPSSCGLMKHCWLSLRGSP